MPGRRNDLTSSLNTVASLTSAHRRLADLLDPPWKRQLDSWQSMKAMTEPPWTAILGAASLNAAAVSGAGTVSRLLDQQRAILDLAMGSPGEAFAVASVLTVAADLGPLAEAAAADTIAVSDEVTADVAELAAKGTRNRGWIAPELQVKAAYLLLAWVGEIIVQAFMLHQDIDSRSLVTLVAVVCAAVFVLLANQGHGDDDN